MALPQVPYPLSIGVQRHPVCLAAGSRGEEHTRRPLLHHAGHLFHIPDQVGQVAVGDGGHVGIGSRALVVAHHHRDQVRLDTVHIAHEPHPAFGCGRAPNGAIDQGDLGLGVALSQQAGQRCGIGILVASRGSTPGDRIAQREDRHRLAGLQLADHAGERWQFANGHPAPAGLHAPDERQVIEAKRDLGALVEDVEVPVLAKADAIDLRGPDALRGAQFIATRGHRHKVAPGQAHFVPLRLPQREGGEPHLLAVARLKPDVRPVLRAVALHPERQAVVSVPRLFRLETAHRECRKPAGVCLYRERRCRTALAILAERQLHGRGLFDP